MNNLSKWSSITALYVLIGGGVTAILTALYVKADGFRALFDGRAMEQTAISTDLDISGAAPAAAGSALAAHLSFIILVAILLLQIFAFLTALLVFKGIKKDTSPLNIRSQKMEDAELFLDLPLYFGLLGTVSSFIVMTYNPQISRLIAYSSTLIGIIFSVLLRLFIQYPLKQALTNELLPAQKKD